MRRNSKENAADMKKTLESGGIVEISLSATSGTSLMNIWVKLEEGGNLIFYTSDPAHPSKAAGEPSDLHEAVQALKAKSHSRNYPFLVVMADTLDKSVGKSVPKTVQVKLPDGVAPCIPPERDSQPRKTPSVNNNDIIGRAKALKAGGAAKVCILNPMNEQCVGGGVFVGAFNFEESLFRILESYTFSMLGKSLLAGNLTSADCSNSGRPEYTKNHVNDHAAFYTEGVRVIKEITSIPGKDWSEHAYRDLAESDQFEISVVGNASIYLDDPANTVQHETLIRAKIRAQLYAAAEQGVTNLLLTDFGCGGFHNDPALIAKWYAEEIIAGGYDKQLEIEFCIKSNNFNVFKKNFDSAYADTLPKASVFVEKWKDREKPDGINVTSDHVLVTNSFSLRTLENQEKLSLRISTWNLMNSCHSKADCSKKDVNGVGLYANNPEDVTETLFDYKARKEIQIGEMLEHLRQGKDAPDIFFLQEIDFLTDRRFLDLKNKFESELKKIGFDLIITPNANCKPQAVIYKASELKLDSKNLPHTLMPGTSVGGNDRRDTLFEVNFVHKTGQKICASSAHLDFAGDYSSALRDYASTKSKTGAMVIWGGDTNHAPGHNIQGLTGDFNHATNYDLMDALPVSAPREEAGSELSYTMHHLGTGKAKTYDGFGFCSPENTIITSTEHKGFRYEKDESGKPCLVEFIPQHPQHASLPGKPWVRRQEIVLDILGYKEEIIKELNKIDIPGFNGDYIRELDEISKIVDAINVLKTSHKHAEAFSSVNTLLENANSLLQKPAELLDAWKKDPREQAKEILASYAATGVDYKRDEAGNIQAAPKSPGLFARAPSQESTQWIQYFDKVSKGHLNQGAPTVEPGKTLQAKMDAAGYVRSGSAAPAQKR